MEIKAEEIRTLDSQVQSPPLPHITISALSCIRRLHAFNKVRVAFTPVPFQQVFWKNQVRLIMVLFTEDFMHAGPQFGCPHPCHHLLLLFPAPA
jgi:hypothetical protein